MVLRIGKFGIILRFSDTIDYINLENLEAAAISIAFEKAFNRINWSNMFAVMNALGIPPFLIQGMKL